MLVMSNIEMTNIYPRRRQSTRVNIVYIIQNGALIYSIPDTDNSMQWSMIFYNILSIIPYLKTCTYILAHMFQSSIRHTLKSLWIFFSYIQAVVLQKHWKFLARSWSLVHQCVLYIYILVSKLQVIHAHTRTYVYN